MTLKRVFTVVAVLLIAAVIAGITWLTPVLYSGTGYAAKNLCSGYFLAGMPGEETHQQALIGASPLLANISYEINEQDQSVSARMLGAFERTAAYSPGIGCTLLPVDNDGTRNQVVVVPAPILPNDQGWPTGRAEPTINPAIQALLAQAFEETDAEAPKNTKAVAVFHRGELIAEQYAPGITAQTPLIGWSMTKSVTNMLIGMLVGDGKLVVDAPAPVPQWQQSADDPRRNITLNALLQMSSGLEFNEYYGFHSDVTQMLSNESDMGTFAANKPLVATDKPIWSYSSGTTNILSGIIRRSVSGDQQSTYAFFRERLFNPLGLQNTTLEMDASGAPIGSSYMYASARDWGKLGQLCLNDGVWEGRRLLPEGWIDYSITPAEAEPSNVYGAQFWLNANPEDPTAERDFPSLPADMYYMSGFQGQIVMMVPSHELILVRLGFTPRRNHGVEKLAADIISALEPAQPNSVGG